MSEPLAEWPTEDRATILGRENDELKARVAELERRVNELTFESSVYREGLAQLHNEMGEVFASTIDDAVDRLRSALSTKVRDVLLRRGKAELFARMKLEFEALFLARGIDRKVLQDNFLDRDYEPKDVIAVAHMLFATKGNQDRLTLGERLANEIIERSSGVDHTAPGTGLR